jgi:hypothetical protein
MDTKSIKELFNRLRSESPNVFINTEDIQNFLAISPSEGTYYYRSLIMDFDKLINIILIDTENHSIKEPLENISRCANVMIKLITFMNTEYNECLDMKDDNNQKLLKVMKYAPNYVDEMKESFTQQYLRHQISMLETVNRYRNLIFTNLLYIEIYIKQIDPKNSSKLQDYFC